MIAFDGFGKLFRKVGVYGIGQAANAATPLLLLPVLTRFLSTADYGRVAMFQALVVSLLPFVGLSAHGALAVNFVKRTESEYWSYYLACLTTIACTFAASIAVMIAARVPLEALSGLPVQWAVVAAFVALGQSIVNLTLANWQVRGEAARFSVYLNLLTLASGAGSVLLVVGLGMDWRGRVLAQLVAVAIAGGVGVAIVFRSLRTNLARLRADVWGVIRFGGPLVPTYGLAAVQVMVGRTVISSQVGLDETGLYLAGYQLASMFLLVLVAFNQAFAPWLYEQLGLGGATARLQIVRLTYAYAGVVVPGAVLFGFASPLVAALFLPERFSGAELFVPWQALAFAFSGLHMMVVNYVFFAERTSLLLISTGAGAIVNVCLTVLFVKRFGSLGATYAQAVAGALQFLAAWYLASRVVEMPWLSPKVWRRERS